MAQNLNSRVPSRKILDGRESWLFGVKGKERTGCWGKGRFHGGRDERLVRVEMSRGRPFQEKGTVKNVF